MKRLVLFFFLIASFSKGQIARYWYFGFGAGLNFSTTIPTALSNGSVSNSDNTSSISDVAGNLLFYTDGQSVWNKNHAVMANGSGLIGNSTAGQCAVIVPIPCAPNKYVIFHVTEFANPGYLNYTVVDMSLNSGLGDVLPSQKNISLGTGWTEKICAFYSPINNNYWVLVHKWNSNQFVAFNVNSTSIATTSMVSSIGSVHNCGSPGSVHDAMGQLTISPDGTKVVNALTCQGIYELFNFNPITGALSNPLSININGGIAAWGAAFSPNSTKLYLNGIFGQILYQFDVSSYNQTAISNSQYTVVGGSTSGYIYGYMELGQDGKVYIARPNNQMLAVINNPNATGASCTFSHSGLSLGTLYSSWGLSRIAYNIPNSSTTSASSFTIQSSPYNFTSCSGQQLTLTASGAMSYTWNGNILSPSIAITPTNNTNYTVSAMVSAGCSNTILTSVKTVTVLPQPLLSITGNATVCSGQSTTITASGANTYSWNIGSTSSSIVVSPITSSSYSVIGSNTFGCVSNPLISQVMIINATSLTIAGYTNICRGQTTTLTASGAASYSWNTSSVNASIVVSPTISSTYSVIGTNSFGCVSIPTAIQVSVSNSLNIAVSGNTLICFGSKASFTANGATIYSWNTIAGGSIYTLVPTSSMQFTVSGSDNLSKCSGEKIINLTVSECLGITEINQSSTIKLYPNPIQNKLIIEGLPEKTKYLNYYIYNALGKLILEGENSSNDGNLLIRTEDWTNGVYFIKLYENNKNFYTSKIIKQ